MSHLHSSRFAHIDLIFFHLLLQVIDQFVIANTREEENGKDELDAWMDTCGFSTSEDHCSPVGGAQHVGTNGQSVWSFHKGKRGLDRSQGPQIGQCELVVVGGAEGTCGGPLAWGRAKGHM